MTRTKSTYLGLLAVLLAPMAANAVPITLIYVNSSSGALYSYDSSAAYSETLIAGSTGAFSISSGPAANTIYIQAGSGALSTYDLTTDVQTNVGGSVPGNALGEGRDGFLYAGSGASLYQVDPGTGISSLIGGGTYGYAGDIAVDPTSLSSMYGAVSTSTGVSLVTVDKTTGAQSLVGSFGVAGSIFGLGFSLDGLLYATGPTASGGGIYTIDKTTGAASLARTVGYSPFDMATQPFEVDEPTTVPEPATLSLLGLGLLCMGAARRRCKA
ncbi:PEP-CTERM sorting domain-containing protein [Marinobacter sp.]|uniref:PEP-CTERM sorting domain-containing protein n=1 Tax=Marinobacter sp. TaxID=50741 RepID=UPI003A8D3B5F